MQTNINIFMILSDREIYVGKDDVPWQVFQMFMPDRVLSFIFGAN